GRRLKRASGGAERRAGVLERERAEPVAAEVALLARGLFQCRRRARTRCGRTLQRGGIVQAQGGPIKCLPERKTCSFRPIRLPKSLVVYALVRSVASACNAC